MQSFKIDHFEREHGIGSFPQVRQLTNEEAGNIEALLKKKMGLPNQSNPDEIFRFIDNKSVDIEGVDATEEGFDLKSILDKLDFCSEKCFLLFANWGRFQEVDELATDDMSCYFSDIYYPSADDVVIVGANLKWLIVITHFGAAKALPLPEESFCSCEKADHQVCFSQ